MIVTGSTRKPGLPLPLPHYSGEVSSAHHDCEHPCLMLCSDTSTSIPQSYLARYRQCQHFQRPSNAHTPIISNFRPSSAFAALFYRCSRDDHEHPCLTPHHNISALGKGTIAGTLQAESTITAFTVCSQLEFSTYKPRSSLTTLSQ
jgi:hypothetical protein